MFDFDSEDDWKYLGRRGGKLDQNLNNAVQKLDSVLKDKDITKLIREINVKVDRLEELVANADEVSADDIESMKALSKSLYKIYSKFE